MTSIDMFSEGELNKKFLEGNTLDTLGLSHYYVNVAVCLGFAQFETG